MSDQELFSQGGAGLVSGYRMTAFGEYADDDSASTLKQRDYKDATDLVCQTRTFRYDDYSQYVEEDLARPCMARDYKGPTDLVCYNNCGFSNYRENNEVSSTLQVQGTECNGGGETLILDDHSGPAVAYGVTAKGNGDVFLSEERHTALSAGGGMPGQGYPTVFSIAGNTIDRQIQNGGNGAGFQEDVSYTLNTIDRHAVAECYSFDSLASNSMKSPNPDSGCRKVEVSKTLDTSNGDPSKNQGGIAVCVFTQNQREEVRDLADCAGAVSAEPGSHQQTYVCAPQGCDLYNWTMTGDIACTLNAATGQSSNHSGPSVAFCAPVAPTIGASGPPYSRPGNERVETEALVCQAPLMLKDREGKPGGGKGILIGEDKSFTLSCNQDQAMLHHASVRRLTPTECERLQGFPDCWTDIPFKGKPAPDGARYKALGNSMAVPCMRWIGERIQMVEDGKL